MYNKNSGLMEDPKIRKLIKKQIKEVYEIQTLNEKTDWYNIALDIAGLIPGYGEPADFANMVDYAIKGDYLFAAFSAISMVPEVGDAVGKGGKAVIGLSKNFKKGSAIVRKLIGVLRSNKGLIDKIFDGLEKNDKVPDKFKVYIPKMKSALELFMQEKFKENKEDERSKYTDDDWENFYLDKDLAEAAIRFGYLKEAPLGPTGIATTDRFGGLDYGLDQPTDYFSKGVDFVQSQIPLDKDKDGLKKIRLTFSEKEKKRFYSLTYTYRSNKELKSKRISQYARAKTFLESKKSLVSGGPILNIKTELPKFFDKDVLSKIENEIKKRGIEIEIDFIDTLKEVNKKEALKAINNDFLQVVKDLGGSYKVQSDNTNVVNVDFTKNYGEEAMFDYNLVTRSLIPAMMSRPEDDKASALYDKLFNEKAKIIRKYVR